MKKIFIVLFFLSAYLSNTAEAQKFINNQEAVLTSKKWTITQVKGKLPNFEVGEIIAFDIDRSFTLKKNDFSYLGGNWIIDNRYLILVVESSEGLDRRMIPKRMKLIKLRNDALVLKYKSEKKETLYLK